MGYPTSVQTFTTKQDGVDFPQASHINVPQTEITAIEDGLLNGLPHPLTVSTGGLTVSTGNTVLGQDLSVAGQSSFAGNVTIAGTLTAQHDGTRVKVTHSAAREIPNAAYAGLSWDTDVYNPNGMHSTSVNSSRITFTESTGVYHVGATVEFNASTGGARILVIKVNDSSGVAAQMMAPMVGVQAPLSISADVHIGSTTDYVTVVAWQNCGSTLSVVNSTFYGNAFWAHKVGL